MQLETGTAISLRLEKIARQQGVEPAYLARQLLEEGLTALEQAAVRANAVARRQIPTLAPLADRVERRE